MFTLGIRKPKDGSFHDIAGPELALYSNRNAIPRPQQELQKVNGHHESEFKKFGAKFDAHIERTCQGRGPLELLM